MAGGLGMDKMQPWQVENIFTMLITGFSSVALYWLGAGLNSFWPFLFLLNMNTPKRSKENG